MQWFDFVCHLGNLRLEIEKGVIDGIDGERMRLLRNSKVDTISCV